MPADDQYDVVHPINVAKEHYGCYNVDRPRNKRYYWAVQRYFMPDGSFDLVSVRVPVHTSRDCRSFYLWDTDARCIGCTVTKDIKYRDRMMGIKSEKP
jgi:hypothetical protein